MKTLLTRTITGLIFISMIILAFFLPVAYSHILFFVFVMLGIGEYLIIVSKSSENSPQPYLIYLTNITLLLAFQLVLYSKRLFILLFMTTLLLIAITFIAELYRKKSNPLNNIALSILPLFWITLPFAIASVWMNYFNQKALVLALFIIIWLYDTLAYCIGSLFGKHKLLERVSPKKSWEGFIGALILTVTISVAFYYIPFFHILSFTSPLYWMIFAFMIVIVATFGDLVESYFKRSADIKDSGHILPGHGGILDRFDSFLLVVPIAFAYWVLTQIF